MNAHTGMSAPVDHASSGNSRLPVLILHTGDPDPALAARHGGYAEQLRRAAGLPPQAVQVVAAYAGERPASPGHYRAALITGSPAMVTDREPWSEASAAWLRTAADHALPMFGVCYGHQLLAHALGGRVGYNAAGIEVGTQWVQVLAAGTTDPFTADLPRRFPAQLVHAQTVLELPPGAIALASSARDPHQIIRIAHNVIATQFHPEFNVAFMRAHLDAHTEHYARKHIDAAALIRSLQPTPQAAGLLRRFLSRYAGPAMHL